MWVVKLGGSLAREAVLPQWLEMLAEVGGGRAIVVPGGGPFADQAREAQAWWQLDDLAGHNMAVLGMAQTALMMQALCPALQLAADEAQIREVLRRGQTALWFPLDLLRTRADELTHWGVSADSLSLWLARRLHAERLLVVKACAIDAKRSFAQLGEAGVLDSEFAGLAREAAFPIDLLEQSEVARARALLLADSTCGSGGGGL
ncbi:MAG TPA: aspartate kinase [Methylibium sp.]|nr:aspartate kinase [Methylibium sp.]